MHTTTASSVIDKTRQDTTVYLNQKAKAHVAKNE